MHGDRAEPQRLGFQHRAHAPGVLPTPGLALRLERDPRVDGDVDPRSDQGHPTGATLDRIGAEDGTQLRGGGTKAGAPVRLVDIGPELLQEHVDRDPGAVGQGEQAQQIRCLAGTPLTFVDAAAIASADLEQPEQAYLEQVVGGAERDRPGM